MVFHLIFAYVLDRWETFQTNSQFATEVEKRKFVFVGRVWALILQSRESMLRNQTYLPKTIWYVTVIVTVTVTVTVTALEPNIPAQNNLTCYCYCYCHCYCYCYCYCFRTKHTCPKQIGMLLLLLLLLLFLLLLFLLRNQTYLSIRNWPWHKHLLDHFSIGITHLDISISHFSVWKTNFFPIQN